KVYVDAQRKAGVDVRPPYHWWREGRKDDYEKRLPEIRKEFPKIENAPLLYWERHGHELPYKLVDKDGKPIDDLPVVYISWRDANAFAASIGMRMPTEFELTRAMRGDGTHTWPWGAAGGDQDKFTQKALELLQMAKTSDLHAKPVGTVPAAAGPFGHQDLFGQVWQLVGDVGYEPLHGVDFFLKQWKLLMKHKTGRLVERKPTFSAARAIAKGGSFLSYQEPIQLLIDARAPVQTSDVLEALGLRLAKSMQPGYDFLYSLQRVKFNRGVFARGQQLDLGKLVGGEHYTLAENGFPSAYDAVAFTPTNWLSDDKRMRWKKLGELSQEQPVLIGALATTAELVDGPKAGLYAVYYRAAGISKGLRTAIKAGYKEIKAARKAAAKAKKNGKEPKQGKPKDSKWRKLTTRAGLTDDDLAEAKASTGDVGFVRIDGIEIPTDRGAYLLAKNGKMVGVIRGTNKKPATGDDKFESQLALAAGSKEHDGKTVAEFQFAVPLTAHSKKKTVVFHLQAVLDLKFTGNWRK
ncbi:MAG TPA: hypothetical protein ENI87_05765, partial [bacterium]|nr:hypothetical protein [bacterium]